MAKRCRVLLWARRNTGRSDVWFGADRSEQMVWADDLALLLEVHAQPSQHGQRDTQVAAVVLALEPERLPGEQLAGEVGRPDRRQTLGHSSTEPQPVPCAG